LGDLTGYDFTTFFNKYIYGNEKLPIEKYFIDSDGDGLCDIDESWIGSDPNKYDSDGDSISDREELELNTFPTLNDSDGDGLTDGVL